MKDGDRTLFSPARAGVFIEACRRLSNIVAPSKGRSKRTRPYDKNTWRQPKAVKTSQKPSCKTKGIDAQNHSNPPYKSRGSGEVNII
jgi:hypothetical protein